MDLGLQDKVALVTGASGGIGGAIARTLAGEGARVAIGYHEQKDSAERVQQEIEGCGGTALVVRQDLTEPASIAEAVAAVHEKWGGPDILVTSAWIHPEWPRQQGPVTDPSSMEMWQQQLRANVEGTAQAVHEVVPHMKEKGFGRIVLISSGAAEDGQPGREAYAGAKAALQGLSRSLSRGLGGAGILSNVVMPGFVATERNRRFVPPQVFERFASTTPTGRRATEDEMARVVAFLASPGAPPEQAAPVDDDPRLSTMFTMDPPRHRQLRSLAFTPATAERLAPRIEEIASDLLDAATPRGEVDVVADLAYPLPVTVIAELLGVPIDRRDDFRRWADAAIAAIGGREADGTVRAAADPAQAEVARNLEEMYAYLGEIVEERRRAPKDDLVSDLVAAEVDGQHLTTNELIAFCGLLLSAGHNTTAQLISNAVLCLDEHPEVVERLRSSPELIPGAIEEVLRYASPLQAFMRFTRKATTIAGQQVEAGQTVFPWMGSANRDETEFPDPDRFDIERQPNRHVGFGRGIHSCLGAGLARTEGRIALTTMLQRLPGRWEVPDDPPLERIPWFFMFGVKRLPLRWTG